MKKAIAAFAVAAGCASPAVFAGEGLAGFYVGGGLGPTTPTTTIEDSDCYYECSAYTNRTTGISLGLKAGQNIVNNGLIYGWDFNYDFVTGADEDRQLFPLSQGPNEMQANTDLKSLLTLRGKGGIVVQNTSLSVLFGYAMGDFDNEFRYQNGTPDQADDDVNTSSGNLNGWLYGLQIEHAVGNLIVGAEVQQIAFETDTAVFQPNNPDYQAHYVNDVAQFRITTTFRF